MYKTIRQIHLWFSVPLGLVMSLISITGLIMLFEPDHSAGQQRPEFFLNVMRLHRWLFDAPAVKGAMTTGKMIVAISVCCMIVAIITGLILWWLRARKKLAPNLKIKINKGFRPFVSSLHVSGGLYVSIFLLIIAFTGLTWSFGWFRVWVSALFAIPKGSHIIYQIHTGAFGGLLTRVIWFVSALIGFLLPLTGYYLWLTRIFPHKKSIGNPRKS